jgi:hypothetical protein
MCSAEKAGGKYGASLLLSAYPTSWSLLLFVTIWRRVSSLGTTANPVAQSLSAPVPRWNTLYAVHEVCYAVWSVSEQ